MALYPQACCWLPVVAEPCPLCGAELIRMLFLVDTRELLKKQPLFHDWIFSAEAFGYLFVYLFIFCWLLVVVVVVDVVVVVVSSLS